MDKQRAILVLSIPTIELVSCGLFSIYGNGRYCGAGIFQLPDRTVLGPNLSQFSSLGKLIQ